MPKLACIVCSIHPVCGHNHRVCSNCCDLCIHEDCLNKQKVKEVLEKHFGIWTQSNTRECSCDLETLLTELGL